MGEVWIYKPTDINQGKGICLVPIPIKGFCFVVSEGEVWISKPTGMNQGKGICLVPKPYKGVLFPKFGKYFLFS